MRKLTLYIHDNNKIQIQRADYIEDGWFIEIKDNMFLVYEIPQGGGNDEFIGTYDSLLSAIEKAEKLS